MFSDLIVEPELAVLGQHHDGGRRERLRHGGYLVYAVLRGRRAEFHARQTVPAHLNDLPVFNDGEREAGDVALLHLRRNEVINSVGSYRQMEAQQQERGGCEFNEQDAHILPHKLVVTAHDENTASLCFVAIITGAAQQLIEPEREV